MKLIYPLEIKGKKTSGFGYRVHPIKKTRTHHNGIDLGVDDGTGVNSVAEGEVVRSDMRNYRGYGNFIIIKHDIDGETFYSAYAHLTKRLVDVGDKVKQGEKIALSGGGQGLAGGGGLSTGPHLHFEIRKSMNGDWVNPEPYINSGEIVKGDLKPESKEKEKPLSSLVVTYEDLSGNSKKLVDATISKLKTLGVTNPYSIVAICSIILNKYGLLTESLSKKILGDNNITIPRDGAHKGQSGWQSNNAWDIGVPIGTPVYAVNSGTVITFNDYGPKIVRKNGKKLFGLGFTVKTDNSLPSVYYTHLKNAQVSKGSKIVCGQLLGYVMDFPGSSFDHLHIGVESGNIRQFITSDGTLKCKSTSEPQITSKNDQLPYDIKNSINKLKTIYGLNITQKHIDNELNQEGNWKPDNGGVDKTAEKKINELISDCKSKFPNISGGVVSGYRSYDDQVTNFGTKAKKRGIENTQKSVTLPGFSQHHTGKAFDIFSVEESWWNKNNDVKEWVANNAANYGFEVTYKKQGSLRIAEPWHLYYTGNKSDEKNFVISPQINDDLEILTKDKDKINNFSTLDEAIDYFSKIELSDGTIVSNTNIRNNTKSFKIGPQKLNMSQSDVDAFFKEFSNIAKIGSEKRKDMGIVDENKQLKEEIYRIKDLIKKIL
jgi:murein DD-endopeptidase MepM/ murein hydrolase activator NlpD